MRGPVQRGGAVALRRVDVDALRPAARAHVSALRARTASIRRRSSAAAQIQMVTVAATRHALQDDADGRHVTLRFPRARDRRAGRCCRRCDPGGRRACRAASGAGSRAASPSDTGCGVRLSAAPAPPPASSSGMLRGSCALQSPMPVPYISDHVIEQRAVAVGRRAQLLQQVGELRHVIVR